MLEACHRIAGAVGGGGSGGGAGRLCGQEDLQDVQVVTAAPHEALSCLRPASGTESKKSKPGEPRLARLFPAAGQPHTWPTPRQVAGVTATTGVSAWGECLCPTQTSSIDVPPKTIEKINRLHSQPLPHFSELETGT